MARLSPVFMLGASLAATLLTQSPGQGQGVLVGCRLGATQQCVPGLTMTPQQQIKVLSSGSPQTRSRRGRWSRPSKDCDGSI